MPYLYILCTNPGSTSFKAKEIVIEYETGTSGNRITGYRENTLPGQNNIPKGAYKDTVATMMKSRSDAVQPDIVGFKTVHAGPKFTGCYELTPEVMAAMRRFAPLAPLHNPLFIQTIEDVRAVVGEGQTGKPVLYSGNFETFYARNMPQWAKNTGLPRELAERVGLERYGFHGNSHFYAAERTGQLCRKRGNRANVITVHLGGSSSVASRTRDKRVQDSSMGATPESTDIPMAARAGAYFGDMQHLKAETGMNDDEIAELLKRESGLVGMSGIPEAEDLRRLYAAIDDGNENARNAMDTFQYRIARELGAQYATIGDVDAVAFTGGMSACDRFLDELLRFAPVIEDVARHCDIIRFDKDSKALPELPKSIINGLEPLYLFQFETDEELVVAQACANLRLNDEHYINSLFLNPLAEV